MAMTYRAAILFSDDRQKAVVLTAPEHAGLSDEDFLTEAREELVRANVEGEPEIGEWTDPKLDAPLGDGDPSRGDETMTKAYTVQYDRAVVLTGATLDDAIARCHVLRRNGGACRIFDETEGAYLSAFAVEYFERHGELPDEAVYAADQAQP